MALLLCLGALSVAQTKPVTTSRTAAGAGAAWVHQQLATITSKIPELRLLTIFVGVEFSTQGGLVKCGRVFPLLLGGEGRDEVEPSFTKSNLVHQTDTP